MDPSWADSGVGTSPKALVHRPSSLEARIERMPMLDGGLAHAPAEQNDFIIEAARKIQQACVEILHLHTDGIDLRNSLASALRVVFDLRTLFRDRADINAHSARHMNSLG